MSLGANVPAPYPASSGTTYYVDKDTGSDADDGLSEANAWATIQHACATAPANAIVRVKKGASAYAENFSISRGGTANNPITMQAFDPANRPSVLGEITKSGVNASYWWWRDFIFDGGSASPNNNLFKITGTGADKHATGVAPHHIGFWNVDAHDALGSGAGFITTYDDVHEIQWWNASSYSNDPLTTTHGWYLNGGHDMHLINYITRDNGGYGIHVFTDSSAEYIVKDVHLYNGLAISQDGRAGMLVQYGSPGLDDVTKVPTGIHAHNCISAFQTQGSAGDRYGWRYKAASITNWAGYGPVCTEDHCITYGNTDGNYDDVDPDMISRTNAITTDPLFVDYAAFNYHLQAGSPAIKAADPDYTPTIDFTGATRVHADIGPYAYTADDWHGRGTP